MSGKLYLIPNDISDGGTGLIFSPEIAGLLAQLRLFFVEEEKAARRLLKRISPQFPIAECEFFPLNEHTPAAEVRNSFQKIAGKDAGIISESGCPCVADPGADIVLLAHQNNMEVIPLVGPSSILLALMASGLNGQNFAFNGYLPKEEGARRQKIKELERRSFKEGQTQIFMEPPYRNQAMLEDVLASCDPQTLLCVASDLTGKSQSVRTRPVREWPQSPALGKVPALFLILKKT